MKLAETSKTMNRSSNTSLGREAALFAVLVVALTATMLGCATTPEPRPMSAGDVALAVPAEADDTTVEVVVTGVDMESPVSAQFEVVEGMAYGTLPDVAAGPNRLVLVTTRDRDGRRCAREINTDVAPGAVAVLQEVDLQCEARPERLVQEGFATAQARTTTEDWTVPPLF